MCLASDLFRSTTVLFLNETTKMSNMEPFDDEGNRKFILEEIQKTDTFYNAFKKEFSELIFNIIQEHYPDAVLNDKMDNLLLAYSVAILNSTESVIDKDRSYPLYRMEEELDAMDRITLKLAQSEESLDFNEAVLLKTKEMIVKYFAAIYDLSSNGFRLLERNVRLYNWEFVSNFQFLFVQNRSTFEQ